MLTNCPFIPEPEEVVAVWKDNLRKHYSQQQIDDLNIDANYFIPKQLSINESGLIDNTGLYNKLNQHYRLSDGYKIDRFPNVLPVFEVANRYDSDSETYKVSSDFLYKNYGFVLSVKEFMSLIGEQLKKSKRKFFVTFFIHSYDTDLFRKNGSLHISDFENFDDSELSEMISFHIYELLDENDYIMSQDDFSKLFFRMFHFEKEKFIEILENFRNEDFMKNIDLD